MPKDVMFYYFENSKNNPDTPVEVSCCFKCAIKRAMKNIEIKARTVPKDWFEPCNDENHK